MKSVCINPETLKFLTKLSNNNNREWFTDNKSVYESARTNVIAVADALIGQMNLRDQLETESGKKSLFRIYNDVRFRKDKSPYKEWFALHLKRAGKERRGGYYMQIKPGASFIALGFWGPEPADLKRIREDIQYEYPHWRKMLSNKTLLTHWGAMQGEQLASVPRGFDKEHPAIDLLRYKQFLFTKHYSDAELQSSDFISSVSRSFQAARPFLDYMSEVLTTDSNGERIVS